jgi:hypothetical protein
MVFASYQSAEAAPGRWVAVWLLEVRYTPGDYWHVAGKYSSYASAQQSYTVRARHGGYTEMRIRQTHEWRPAILDHVRIDPNTKYKSPFAP